LPLERAGDSAQPYRCARDDYSEGVLLDANENALGHSISASTSATPIDDFDSLDLNRYPDPAQMELKSRIAKLRNIEAGAPALFLGIGSDEACDLIMRCTCVPGIDQVLGARHRLAAR
jgi:histidinol-phosphate aminotransferase